MFGLVVSADAYPDESLHGYIHRLANFNGLSGRVLLKTFAGSDDDDLGKWLTAKPYPDIWSGMIEELRNPVGRPIRIWNQSSCRYCPDCLDEQGYWRASWGLSLVTCCTRHRRRLIELCPACEMPVILEAMRDNRCTHCTRDLGKHPRTNCDTSTQALWLSRQFEYRLNAGPIAARHITRHLSLEEFNEFAWRLGVRAMQSNCRQPLKSDGSSLLSRAEPIADAAGQAIQNWPRGFFELIERIRGSRDRAENWKIPDAIGPLYQDIYSSLDGAHFDFLRDTFSSYVREHWDGPISLRNRNLSDEFVNDHPWLSMKEASEMLKVDQALIQRLVASQEISSTERRYQSGRTFRLVNRNEIQQLTVRLNNALTLEQAAKQLALSEVRVRQLIDGGLVVAIGGAPSAGSRWWIDFESIDRLGKCAQAINEMPEKIASISYLIRYHISNKSEFIALIQAVLAGEMQSVKSTDENIKLGDSLLDMGAFESWLSNRRPRSKTVSVVEAAQCLGIKQEVAYALVRIGLLSHMSKADASNFGRALSVQAINQFKKDFVMGPELANRLATSPKVLPTRLAAAGFLPIAGPNVNNAKCRQYVWRRSKRLMNFVSMVSMQ